MCGLVGMANADILVPKHVDVMKDLLVVSSLRGAHSAGVGLVGKTYNRQRQEIFVETVRRVGNPYNLLESKPFEAAMVQTGKRVIIGHTRHATIGAKTEVNAHPFLRGNIMGAHNGTITSGLWNADAFGTDSEALFNMFDEYGIENSLPEISGAWALTWYDDRNESLNFLRNSGRPLYICFDEAKETIYWASEEAMLWHILGRHNIKFTKPEPLPVDELITFQVFPEGNAKEWTKTIEKKPMKGKEVQSRYVTGGPFPASSNTSAVTEQARTTPTVHTGPATDNTRGTTSEQKGKEETKKVDEIGKPVNKEATASTAVVPFPANSSSPTNNPNTHKPRIVAEAFQQWRHEKKGRSKDNSNSFDKRKFVKGFKGRIVPREHYNKLLRGGCVWCAAPLGPNTSHPTKYRWLSTEALMCEDCFSDPRVKDYVVDIYCQDADEISEPITSEPIISTDSDISKLTTNPNC